jgi:hypothetical protein
VPLDGTLDLLDKALATLVEESGGEISRAEIGELAAAMGLLNEAVDTLIRETEAVDGACDDGPADHAGLR